jgi:hypothetical protein
MSDFAIHYLSECPNCGGNIDDPFMDDLCFQCDHRRHSVAPWDAPECGMCWPDDAGVDDGYPTYDEPDDEPAPRDVRDVPTGGLL